MVGIPYPLILVVVSGADDLGGLTLVEHGQEEEVSLLEGIWAGPHWKLEVAWMVVELLRETVELGNAVGVL